MECVGSGNGHLNGPGSEPIRDQLDRILSSAVFRNSRRNSSLLRHVVDRALEGRTDELKERNIGIDVFCRPADYDTNTDHVVRSVAGEVRRRLAQYYMEPGHEAELRIDLVAGSYVPQFRSAAPLAVPEPMETHTVNAVAAGWFHPGHHRPYWLAAIGISLLLAFGLLAAFLIHPAAAIDKFWGPLLSSSGPALICFGGGGQANTALEANLALSISEFEHLPIRRMHTSDAVALADIAGLLQARRKSYRVLNRANSTSFRDLQTGPFVLIGGMNNEWTLRLTNDLRFSFVKEPNGARVVDRQAPSNTSWSVDFTTPVAQFNRDYAIVSRVRDPKTEQTVVIVAGIGSWGTLAAGEFVARPEYLEKLEKKAPRHWERQNLQVVLATDVIHGSSGPPILLAAYSWQ
jgi:hypothetical protein